jgi:hypothetical protein
MVRISGSASMNLHCTQSDSECHMTGGLVLNAARQ